MTVDSNRIGVLLAVIKKDDRLKPVAEKILERIDCGELKGVYASTADDELHKS